MKPFDSIALVVFYSQLHASVIGGPECDEFFLAGLMGGPTPHTRCFPSHHVRDEPRADRARGQECKEEFL